MSCYRTTDLKLAGVLQVRGFTLNRIKKTADRKRAAFYFENAYGCRRTRSAYYNGTIVILALRLAHAMDDLKAQADDILAETDEGEERPDPPRPRLVVRSGISKGRSIESRP